MNWFLKTANKNHTDRQKISPRKKADFCLFSELEYLNIGEDLMLSIYLKFFGMPIQFDRFSSCSQFAVLKTSEISKP